MTDPAPFLRHMRQKLEGFGMDPETAKRAAMAVLMGLNEVEVPSPSEIDQIRIDARVLDLMTKGTEPAEAARRLGCAPSTVYRRLKRALNIKRAA